MIRLWKYLPSFILWILVFYFLSERAIFRYQHMGAGVDIGLFENIFYNLIHTGKAITSLGLDGNLHHYFADHINWFIFPISIIYYYFPYIESLLILQALILSLPILIFPYFGNQKSYHLIYPLLYALFLPIYWIHIFDFHPEVLWIPFFFLFYLFWKKQSKIWILFFLLSLLTKEETCFVWIVFSYLQRKMYPKESLFITMISVIYFIIAIGLLILFHDEFQSNSPAHLERYKDPFTALSNFHLFPYLILFLSLPFLFFNFKHQLMYCLFPYLIYSILSKFEVNKTPFTHHSFITIPIVFLSYIEIVENLDENRKKIVLRISLLISIFLFLFYGPISKSYSYRKEFMNRSVSNSDYLTLRKLLPNESIVSNIPQYLSNRKEIQLYLPNQTYSADYYVRYRWGKESSDQNPPSDYQLQSSVENHIQIFIRKKID
ncbi:DUF2079 domain-containing protein [Leptospira biflexa]|uniref:DUF2079 domain-containing protein n=1 Tax=Leptospira biflexa TaxID=172 RepID=UPI001091678F|nr:DUF2079 domain-containing protein [Leptospira biflexa]TGM48741.1 DUF2079 domain-containing protein [Leptospira biflexa]TGM51191.1 DUF2079 domain-containing protein [Leptospira biflexa]